MSLFRRAMLVCIVGGVTLVPVSADAAGAVARSGFLPLLQSVIAFMAIVAPVVALLFLFGAIMSYLAFRDLPRLIRRSLFIALGLVTIYVGPVLVASIYDSLPGGSYTWESL